MRMFSSDLATTLSRRAPRIEWTFVVATASKARTVLAAATVQGIVLVIVLEIEQATAPATVQAIAPVIVQAIAPVIEAIGQALRTAPRAAATAPRAAAIAPKVVVTAPRAAAIVRRLPTGAAEAEVIAAAP